MVLEPAFRPDKINEILLEWPKLKDRSKKAKAHSKMKNTNFFHGVVFLLLTL